MKYTDYNFSRRRFLAGTGGLAAAWALSGATALTALSACSSGSTHSSFAYWSRREKGSLSDLEYLVMCATLAPSPHNTQPWRFALDGDRIDIYADLKRHLTSADADYRMMLIAIGCAIENMSVAAQHLGYRVTVDATPADQHFRRNGYCASLRLQPGAAVAHPWFDAIFDRQTTRTKFLMTQPDATLRQRLQAPQPDLPGIGLHWMTLGPLTQRLGRIVSASAQVYLTQSRHDDGMRWFRITRDEWQRKGDGIAVFNGAAPYLVKQYVETLVDPEDLGGQSFIDAEVDSVRQVVDATPLWGLIYADRSSPQSRILAGRMAERAYLEATARGYGLQPLCYPTELPEVARGLAQLAGLASGAEPLFLFRVGKSDHVGKSVRRKLDDVILR